MDLGSIQIKLKNKFYSNFMQFGDDVRKTFNNSFIYNDEEDDDYKMTSQASLYFE